MPKPPSLHLPTVVTNLTANRIGNRVDLFWTSPSKTTDGVLINFPFTVELCRDQAASAPPKPAQNPNSHSRRTSPRQPAPSDDSTPAPPSPCTPILHTPGHEGASTLSDTLPSALTTDAATLIAYRIRLVNPRGHSAGPSAPAVIAAGPPVPPIQDFHATQIRAGVLLEWSAQPTAPNTTVEILRTAQTPPPPKKQPSTPAKPAPPPAEVRLRQSSDYVSPVQATQPNTDGMLDAAALMNETYTYSAQRVATFNFAGVKLESRSEPTPPQTLALRDTFAPDPPTGLASIPGTTGSGPAAKPTIDLSWDANTDPDIAGYHVYRVDLTPGSPTTPLRLTPTPLRGPAYRDTAVLPGHHYRYSVSAIDKLGNESNPSTPVEDTPQTF